jgi:hypothetical protein
VVGGRDFHYPVAAEAKTALEDTGAQTAYRRELRAFRVTHMQVTGEALVQRGASPIRPTL